MEKAGMARFKAQARIIKALAHPTRLLIVDELSRRSRCVCELTAMAGVDASTVSKHLAVLKSVGILWDEKKGLQVHYHLKTPCVTRILDCALNATRSTAREAVEAVR
jgi:DNA-binding transcriptional ArsR family regulator